MRTVIDIMRTAVLLFAVLVTLLSVLANPNGNPNIVRSLKHKEEIITKYFSERICDSLLCCTADRFCCYSNTYCCAPYRTKRKSFLCNKSSWTNKFE